MFNMLSELLSQLLSEPVLPPDIGERKVSENPSEVYFDTLHEVPGVRSQLMSPKLDWLANYAETNLAILGEIGSGKTTLVKMLLKSFISVAQSANKPVKLVVVDLYGEYEEFLEKIGLPITKFSTSDGLPNWILSEDLSDKALRKTFAHLLASLETKKDHLKLHHLEKFLLAHLEFLSDLDSYDLNCLIEVLDSDTPDLILSTSEEGRSVLKKLNSDAQLASNLTVSANHILYDLCDVAEEMRNSDTTFSIQRWLAEPEGILYLRIDAAYISTESTFVRTLIGMLLACQQELTRKQKVSDTESSVETYFVFDDLCSIRDIPYLSQQIANGHKYRSSVIINTQCHSTFEKLYGKIGAKIVLDNILTKIILRNSLDTADWASQALNAYGTLDVRSEDLSMLPSLFGSKTLGFYLLSPQGGAKVKFPGAYIDSVLESMPKI
jgi:Cdc6-like AAA superfamily ATPase